MKDLFSIRDWSLRLRLLVFFAVFLLAAGGGAGFFAWQESRVHIDRFFDTQQLLFAKTLATADIALLAERLPKNQQILPGVKKKEQGKQDKNALGFAVFSNDGKLLMSDGEKGDGFVFEGWLRGFSDTHIKRSDESWRIVWVTSPDGGRVVAVGQEIKYRQRMAFAMLRKQLKPWLLLFPVLLAGLLWMLNRELSPLRKVAENLETRSPQEASHLETRGIPPEVRPLVTSLNSLFDRTRKMLFRERAFISDAAHELRTPLAGLRVQAEVVQLSINDPKIRDRAIAQLIDGIDSCGRLVEQLLTLSRLESLGDLDTATGLERKEPDWRAIVEETTTEYGPRMEDKGIHLDFFVQTLPLSKPGYPALLGILVRNLMDNAVKYTPENGVIRVTLDRSFLRFENTCDGIPEELLPRLGERFFRPPGQKETGSGLGLSIARQIAESHGCRLSWWNGAMFGGLEGFAVQIYFGKH